MGLILNLNLLSSSLLALKPTTTVASGPCGSRALMARTWKPTVTLFAWATTTVLGSLTLPMMSQCTGHTGIHILEAPSLSMLTYLWSAVTVLLVFIWSRPITMIA